MKIIKDTAEKLVLRMEANESLANALRRSVDEVKVLAVDEVEFFKNDSALYDEMVAHRIGLIPLKTDKKMNAKTEIDLKLKKTGPGLVYSGDLKGTAELVHDDIPITLLEKDQSIELIATARLGDGIQHGKYVPGLFYYRQLYNVKSKNPKVEQLINNSEGLVKEKVGTGWLVDLTESEEEEMEKLDKEALNESGEILIFVESYGQMKSKDILTNTIDALTKNLELFGKSIWGS